MRPNRLGGFGVLEFATLRQWPLIHVGILQLRAKFQNAMVYIYIYIYISIYIYQLEVSQHEHHEQQ